MRLTREQLVRADDEDPWFVECLLYGYGYGTIESDIHDENCVFFDPEVDRVWVEGRKRMAYAWVCGRCDVKTEHCVVNGWALTTHEKALKICKRYKERYSGT